MDNTEILFRKTERYWSVNKDKKILVHTSTREKSRTRLKWKWKSILQNVARFKYIGIISIINLEENNFKK
jgi:hypothetical protein